MTVFEVNTVAWFQKDLNLTMNTRFKDTPLAQATVVLVGRIVELQ
jgi:hypothetical protein